MDTKTVMTVWKVCDEWDILSTWANKEDAEIVLGELQEKYPDSQFYVTAVSVQQIRRT